MTVLVKLTGLVADDQTVYLHVYDDQAQFPQAEGAVQTLTVQATDSTVTVPITLEPGTWAITAHHDQNGNGELDFQWLPPGPSEGTSASCPKRPLTLPGWEDCSFDLQADSTLTLTLWY